MLVPHTPPRAPSELRTPEPPSSTSQPQLSRPTTLKFQVLQTVQPKVATSSTAPMPTTFPTSFSVSDPPRSLSQDHTLTTVPCPLLESSALVAFRHRPTLASTSSVMLLLRLLSWFSMPGFLLLDGLLRIFEDLE